MHTLHTPLGKAGDIMAVLLAAFDEVELRKRNEDDADEYEDGFQLDDEDDDDDDVDDDLDDDDDDDDDDDEEDLDLGGDDDDD
jgi:hypothetical protein